MDIDSEKACWWAKEHLPATPIVTISGRDTAGWRGQHWYYRRPETKSDERVGGRVKVQWVNDFDEGRTEKLDIDVKADEAQVVAPGSVHGTGGVYEEAAPWTAEGFAAMPTFDPAWFPRVEPEPGEEGAEPIEIPEVAVERSAAGFRRTYGIANHLGHLCPRRALACLCSTLRASAYGASPWSRGTRRRSCRNPTE